MRFFTTGEVRRLFSPPLPESRIRNRIRAGAIEPALRMGGQYLWTPEEVARLAELLGVPAPGSMHAPAREHVS